MHHRRTSLRTRQAVLLITLVAAAGSARGAAEQALPTVVTKARKVANLHPAGSYATPITALRFDPRLDVQPRGLPEGQADVSVRGGVFESTGFSIGAATLLDPQTGHYAAELPVHPRMLSAPEVLTGVDNALAGFNSSVATVRHELMAMRDGGEVRAGAGDHGLRLLDGWIARTFAMAGADEVGAELAWSSSRGDGSRPHGDHDFDRLAARLQHRGAAHQTDLLYGRQEKFFGWPGAYTGFATFAETDYTKTDLFLVSHRRELSGGGWWSVGGWFRGLENDYDFDRTTAETGVPGAFEHETRSVGLAARGAVPGRLAEWHWSVQWIGDELVRSTDLTGGEFDRRRYAKLALVPERSWELPGNASLSIRGGLTLDHSDRDADAVLPVLGVSVTRLRDASVDRISIEYAATSQVPGYTALKSPPDGLFGGNPHLGRERSDTVALSVEREAHQWHGRITLFHRHDDDLVDWTYASGAPFVRQANPVDVSVQGLELELGRRWGTFELVGGYTRLHQDEDYGTAEVDASYYALNHAKDRLTLALRYAPVAWLDVRLDNELSRYRGNLLRTSDDDVYQAALTVGWLTPVPGLRVDLGADNLTNDDFQHFPGTPPPRRQFTLQARYGW